MPHAKIACPGAGAYAFENVRTSVEHGCRHVWLPSFASRGLARVPDVIALRL